MLLTAARRTMHAKEMSPVAGMKGLSWMTQATTKDFGMKTITKSEWLNSDKPSLMLKHLQGKTSDRKLRLFAVACCRRIWQILVDELYRSAVQAAESYADGIV